MLISASRLTLGKNPEPKYIGKKGTLLVSFPVAENHNKKNKDGEWETVGTSWYQMEAWGETAEDILAELSQGDSFELVKGIHKVDKVEDKYYHKYNVLEFKKIEKNYD